MMSSTANEHVGRAASRARTRAVKALVVGLSALLSLWLGPTTAAVADGPLPTPTARDRLSVSAYDFLSEVPADVVAGSQDNNLRVDFVAGRPLVDGTVVVTLPRREWRTDLHPAGGLREGDPDLPGSFVVRPVDPDFPPGAGDCRGTATDPVTVTTVNTAKRHVGVVQHLSCTLGQRISVRIVGISAPRSIGVHTLGVSVSDASGQRGPSALDVKVVRRPTSHLAVDVPRQVTIYEATPVVVRALRPDGRVDTRARGWVRLTGPGGDPCIFESGGLVQVELTRADAGVKVAHVYLQVLGTQRIEAMSESHRARPGLSAPFVVSGQPHGAVCSVSYH